MTATEPLVLRTRDSRGVVTLTLNRPEAFNAMSEGLLTTLQQELDGVAEDTGARAVVLAGAGKAFCAGHDLKEMRAAPSLSYYESLFDLAVASSDARFAVSGVNLGLFCSTPSVALSRNLHRKAAFEMLVTGEFISAAQALEKGLVNRLAAPERLDAEVESIVARIVANPQVAIAMGKQLFYRQLETGIEAAYEDAAKTMACNMMDDSALEGVQAFIEKRSPNW
jgi:enoyl-CoA hydratase/carnithine racemase